MVKKGVKNYMEIIEYLRSIILGTKFENHVFSVGGCERDLILDAPIKDIDIVIDLPNGGIEFANWLKDNDYTVGSVVVYEHFGTAMFRLKDYPDEEIEAVQTRKECYRDMESRNPETAFGSIMDDCQRRDFTINAIYRNISTGDILDLNGKSFDDITDGWIRACGDPNIIFSEDPLRILRAVRFKYRLGDHFLIEKDTYQGILAHKDRLSIISQERITDEFSKIITGKNADQAFNFLLNLKVLHYIFPCDLDEMTLKSYMMWIPNNSMDAVPSNLEIRLSRIFKAFSDSKTEEIMRNMRYSNDVIKNVIWFKNHSDAKLVSDIKGLRKFMYECKTLPRFINALSVFRADEGEEFHRLVFGTALKKVGNKMFGYKLPVDGNDIMKILDIEGGPIIRKILNELLDLAFDDPTLTKDDFIKYVVERYKK